jgi:hypothetical protein
MNHRYSKLSRWQQQLRVIRKPQENDPQVPLDVITQTNALGITQSHFGCTIKHGDEWERVA